MRIDWGIAPVSEWAVDVLIFFGIEGSFALLPGFQRWLDGQGQWITRSAALKDFQGKFQQTAVIYGPADSNVPRVLVAGLGSEEKFDVEKLQGATSAALRKCRDLGLNRVGISLQGLQGLPVPIDSALKEVLVGGLLGLHRFDELKTREIQSSEVPESLVILDEGEPEQSIRAAPRAAEAVASGICLARDLVSSPANRVTPGFMVETARGLAQRYGFRLEVIDAERAGELGMGSFTAVAQGSREPAYMIVLERFSSIPEKTAPLVLVGKGITFDTGGISLKNKDRMDAMKQDMAGAAAVLGVFETLGRMNAGGHVVGIMPCTENMPDGKAYKPGDVVKSLSGLTVEVISTDAEGRMVLCDALTYALDFQPAAIVDIATLTAACIVAFGNEVAAVMGNCEALTKSILDIGSRVGEKYWPLPLWDFYFDHLKSDIADFKNVADRSAGAILGGIFLKQFVPASIPWAHIDIAGTAWTDKELGTAPRGATGFGVRTMVELACTLAVLGIK